MLILFVKAARIYTSLFPEIIADCQLLKKSLLRNFCKTPGSFRVDFRSSKIQLGEMYEQFNIQLGHSLEQWLESSNIDQTSASLKDFMVFDQYISSLLPDLHICIKYCGVHMLGEAVQ